MPNFRYRVDDADIILSPEEHLKVKDAIERGTMVIGLRNWTLSINVNFIRYIKETSQLTEEQERLRREALALPSPEEIPMHPDRAKQIFCETRTNLPDVFGSEHPQDCWCKNK